MAVKKVTTLDEISRVRRVFREIKILRNLNHVNVLTISEIFGTQFPCCTGTKVQILTQKALLDFNYYHTLLKQRKYTIDEDVVRTYFPLAKVKAGLLEAYQTILSLIFTKVEKPEDSAPVWHPDVEMWEVHDAGSKEFVGYFYLDLFPREGAQFTCFTGTKV